MQWPLINKVPYPFHNDLGFSVKICYFELWYKSEIQIAALETMKEIRRKKHEIFQIAVS